MSFKHYLNLMTALLLMLSFSVNGQSKRSNETYYYNGTQQVVLPFDGSRFLIQFNTSLTKMQQLEVLNYYGLSIEKIDLLPKPNVTVVYLNQPISEKKINDMINDRNRPTVIDYVSPFYNYKGTRQTVTKEVLVQLKSASDLALLTNMVLNIGAVAVENNNLIPNLYTVKLDFDKNTIDVANQLHTSGYFEYAEPNFLRFMRKMTTDPMYATQWSIENLGTVTHPNGLIDADMDVNNAWAITTGNSNIKVAVLDEGVDLVHPDLINNLLGGYDATGLGSNGGVSGDDAHGTACAGIIAAQANNNIGMAGVAYNCKIIPVRIAYSDANGNWVTSNSVIGNAITWAWQTASADVLSNSWGGGSSSTTINNAFTAAITQGRSGLGAPVLVAAGNDDSAVSYPATLSNVIAVGAMSMCNQRKSPTSCDNETFWGSNYGAELDVIAPGVKIVATDISGSAGYSSGNYTSSFNGTSSATPNAAGVMALILSANLNLTATQARNILELSCEKVGNYAYAATSGYNNGTWNNEMGYGRVNAYNAVTLATGGTIGYCSGTTTLVSSTGSFDDGSATNNYNNNSNCSWLIQPAGATSITLSFSAFNTENTNDYVKVYDGATTSATLLGTFSGSTIPANLTSTGGSMLIEFITNSSVTSSGWAASYVSLGAGTYCIGTTTLTAPSGSFSDGSGSNDYGDNADCKWVIKPTNASTVTLSFTTFNVESGYDYVKVYDDTTTSSTLLGTFTGTVLPAAVTSSTGRMLVHFTSDNTVTAAGFSVNYTSSSNCGTPTNLSLSAQSSTTTQLSWSGSANSYTVEYGATGFTQGTGTVVSSNTTSINLINLLPATTYQVYVRGNCTNNVVSSWTTAFTFTTYPTNTFIIGSGSATSSTSTASPINIWYRSLRYQTVYTAAELTAAGLTAGNISGLGWNVVGTPSYSLPNYTIKMKHTTATNTAAHDGTNLTQVYNNALYAPVVGGFDMLMFQTPFTWDGVSNLLIDVCFDQVSPTYDASGTVKTYTASNGSRFIRADNSNQCGLATTTTQDTKPQVMLSYSNPCGNFVLNTNTVVNETCAGSNDGSISVSVNSLNAVYYWLDDANITTSTRNNLSPATYTVIATDAIVGCSDTLSIVINAGEVCYPDSCLVVWGNRGGVSLNASGNTLRKTNSVGWNAGAISMEMLASNTDGWVEMQVLETSKRRVIGLTPYNTSLNQIMAYSIDLRANGQYAVVENGTTKTTITGYATNDKFRINRTNTTVTYLRNGTVFYTSAVPSNNNLYVDVSLYGLNSSIHNVYASFGCAPIDPCNGFEINLELLADETCAGDNDGFAEVSSNETGTSYTWSNNPSLNTPYQYDLPEGNYIVIGTSNETGCHDTVAFTIQGGAVVVLTIDSVANESCLGLSDGYIAISGNYPNLIYEWIDDPSETGNIRSNLGAWVYTVTATHSELGCSAELSINVDEGESCVPDSCLVDWHAKVNVAYSGTTLTKTSTTASWNAGARSIQMLPSGTDGWFETTVLETNKQRTFGLSTYNTSSNATAITYAIRLSTTGKISIFENNVTKGTFGNYTAGMKLRVARVGTTIYYYRNNTLFYTSTLPSTTNLYADVSLHTSGSTIHNAYVNFGCLPAPTNTAMISNTDATQTDNVLIENNAVDIFTNESSVDLENITVYPNPTHTDLTIKYDLVVEKIQSMSLHQLTGQRIMTLEISDNGQTTISMTDLPSGVYILNINGTKNIKVVKL
jgi:subtilisin family serine protease